MSDEEATNEALDVETFLDLLSRHEAQIMSFLYSISWPGTDAEDLFQQTVLTMWQKISEFKPDTNFVAWACQIAKFKALDAYKKGKKELLLDTDLVERLVLEYGEEEYEERLLRRRALSQCMFKLSEEDRNLIELRYGGDQSMRDVAEQKGRSSRSIYKSLARIRKCLLDCVLRTLKEEGA